MGYYETDDQGALVRHSMSYLEEVAEQQGLLGRRPDGRAAALELDRPADQRPEQQQAEQVEARGKLLRPVEKHLADGDLEHDGAVVPVQCRQDGTREREQPDREQKSRQRPS